MSRPHRDAITDERDVATADDPDDRDGRWFGTGVDGIGIRPIELDAALGPADPREDS